MTAKTKARLGPAISAMGSLLFGSTALTQFTSIPDADKRVLLYVSIFGFVASAAGKMIAMLFAEDAKQHETDHQI